MESPQTKTQATLKEEVNRDCKIMKLCYRYNIPSDVDGILSKGYEFTEVTSDQKQTLSQAVRTDNPNFEEWNLFLRSLLKTTYQICVLTKFLENYITQNSHDKYDKQMVRANLQTIKDKLKADIITLTVGTEMINTPIVKKYLMCWYVLNEYVNCMSKDSDAKS